MLLNSTFSSAGRLLCCTRCFLLLSFDNTLKCETDHSGERLGYYFGRNYYNRNAGTTSQKMVLYRISTGLSTVKNKTLFRNNTVRILLKVRFHEVFLLFSLSKMETSCYVTRSS